MTARHILALPGFGPCAQLLAAHMRSPWFEVAVHHFPDGESLVRVPMSASEALVYCSLDRPNEKLVELMLVSGVLRRHDVKPLTLIAPYMCYMRQDKSFHEGEAVSQQIVGHFLAGMFDRILTIDPHLHRTPDIGDVFPGITARALCAAPLLGQLVGRHPDANAILVGPDSESRSLVAKVATPLGLDIMIGEKVRCGDRDVKIEFSDPARVRGRTAIIIDDVISSGTSLSTCTRTLIAAGATQVHAVVVHALYQPHDAVMMEQAGIQTIRSTDSVLHPSNAISVAPLLAEALMEFNAP